MSAPSKRTVDVPAGRPRWQMPLVLAGLATALSLALAARWPGSNVGPTHPEEDTLEIVSVVPETPRPGGSLRVVVDGADASKKLELLLAGRPVEVIARLGNQLMAVAPLETELGHRKLRVAVDAERSKAAHVDFVAPLDAWRLTSVLGAVALVLFGVSSLRLGLQRTLGSAAARAVAAAFRTPLRGALVGLLLGVVFGKEPAFGAGLLLTGAALELGTTFACAAALLAFWTGSRFALGPVPMGALAGAWLLIGIWYASVQGKRRVQSAGLVVLGLGALLLGAHLLHSPPGSGLVWFDAPTWATLNAGSTDWGAQMTVFTRSLLFSMWEQDTRGIEGILDVTLAARAQHAIPWGVVLIAWLGANCGSLLTLAPALLGPAPVRRASATALLSAAAAALVAFTLSPVFSASALGGSASLTARATLMVAVLFGGVMLGCRVGWGLRFRRSPVPAPADTAGAADALARSIHLLRQALVNLCRAVHETDRGAAELGAEALERARLQLIGAQELGAADPRLAAAAFHTLGIQQALATASGLVEAWTDHRILEQASDHATHLSDSALDALRQVERHLSEGLDELQHSVTSGRELSIEGALQREIWIHASTQPERPLAGPQAPYLLAFLQSLALASHELYRVSELFGDDPVAPGRLALTAD